ncbi:MAG TPA: polysaccharide deacetylase family protein [Kofleriaceae bacterium]|nr:polysaccharide deacetylase family protein [Kofleriaceae bacterium]
MLAAILVWLVAPGEVRAGWPRPAAGESMSGDPEVIFTFDDGPHEKWSSYILDTLALHRVSAIFYWVGHRVEGRRRFYKRRKALVDRAVREGHLIGNHTVNHVHLCHRETDAAAEIDHNDLLYRELAELPIILFRAPYGDSCRKLVGMLIDRGLTHLHWDIDPREYNGLTAEGTAEYVIEKLKRLRGRAVVLMHDTKGASARALPRILDWIAAENLRREKRGKRPIRILSGSDLMVERGRGPLWMWGEDAAGSARGWLGRQVASLVPGAKAPSEPAPAPAVLGSAEPPREEPPEVAEEARPPRTGGHALDSSATQTSTLASP